MSLLLARTGPPIVVSAGTVLNTVFANTMAIERPVLLAGYAPVTEPPRGEILKSVVTSAMQPPVPKSIQGYTLPASGYALALRANALPLPLPKLIHGYTLPASGYTLALRADALPLPLPKPIQGYTLPASGYTLAVRADTLPLPLPKVIEGYTLPASGYTLAVRADTLPLPLFPKIIQTVTTPTVRLFYIDGGEDDDLYDYDYENEGERLYKIAWELGDDDYGREISFNQFALKSYGYSGYAQNNKLQITARAIHKKQQFSYLKTTITVGGIIYLVWRLVRLL